MLPMYTYSAQAHGDGLVGAAVVALLADILHFRGREGVGALCGRFPRHVMLCAASRARASLSRHRCLP